MSSQRRSTETRKRILGAALELIAEKGIQGITYRSVGELAEVGQGVMTYHFGSRKELLAQAFLHHQERIRTEATAMAQPMDSDSPPQDPSKAMFNLLKRMVGPDRSYYLAEFELTLELARDPELRKLLGSGAGATRALATELMREAGSPDPGSDAILLSSMLEGLTLEWMASPDDRQLERRIRKAVRRAMALFAPAISERLAPRN